MAFLEAVVETGSVTRAAERLGCVQSNVTARLKKLEARLGRRLVERIDSRMMPTAAGMVLLDYGRRVRSLMEEAEWHVRASGTKWPPLRLGTMETTAAIRLPALLQAIREHMPDMRLSLRTGTSTDLAEGIKTGALDLAFVAEDVLDPGCDSAWLWEERLVEVRPARRAPEDAVIVFREGCVYRQRTARAFGDAGILELGTLDGIIGCVSAGLGRTLLPAAAVERWCGAGDIETRAVDPAIARVATFAVWRHGSASETSIREVVRIAMMQA